MIDYCLETVYHQKILVNCSSRYKSGHSNWERLVSVPYGKAPWWLKPHVKQRPKPSTSANMPGSWLEERPRIMRALIIHSFFPQQTPASVTQNPRSVSHSLVCNMELIFIIIIIIRQKHGKSQPALINTASRCVCVETRKINRTFKFIAYVTRLIATIHTNIRKVRDGQVAIRMTQEVEIDLVVLKWNYIFVNVPFVHLR